MQAKWLMGEVEQTNTGRHAVTQRRAVMQVTWSLVAGGAEMYALTIASHLDARKYKGMLCAVDQGGALEAEIQQLGIPYFVMNRRPGIELGLMWRLYKLFRQHRVAVLHTHHFNQLFYSFLGAKLVGARIIHTEHSTETYTSQHLRIALRLLAIFCRRVIAIGSDVANELRRMGIPQRKIEIIRAGVDLAAFDGLGNESRNTVRRALRLAEGDRVAVIVARLYPEKNHQLLLAAFTGVIRRVPQARLLIVGEGVEQEAISAEIVRLGLSEQVHMLGVRRDIAALLVASDVFVLSSDREGLPIAVLEAMAAARPVVATAVGDLPAVVQDGVTGRLVPPSDREALARALGDLLSAPERAAQMGATARVAVQSYSLDTMIGKFESLYARQ